MHNICPQYVNSQHRYEIDPCHSTAMSITMLPFGVQIYPKGVEGLMLGLYAHQSTSSSSYSEKISLWTWLCAMEYYHVETGNFPKLCFSS